MVVFLSRWADSIVTLAFSDLQIIPPFSKEETYLEYILEFFLTYLRYIRNISRTYLGHILDMSWTCLEHN